MTDKLDKKQIIELLPHREPMLLIDQLINIKKYLPNYNLQENHLNELNLIFKQILKKLKYIGFYLASQ